MKPNEPNPQQVRSQGLSQGQMTVGQARERACGLLAPSCFCLLEAEDLAERRRLLAQAYPPGA